MLRKLKKYLNEMGVLDIHIDSLLEVKEIGINGDDTIIFTVLLEGGDVVEVLVFVRDERSENVSRAYNNRVDPILKFFIYKYFRYIRSY